MRAAHTIDPTGVDANCGIYALRRTDKPEVYVGQSTDLRDRLRCHKQAMERGKHNNRRLQRIFNTHGFVFDVEYLAVGFDPTDKDMLTLAEQEFMDAAKDALLNLAPAAGSTAGVKYAAERCLQMSLERKGKPRPAFVVTEEARAVWRANGSSRKGVPRSVAYPLISDAIVAGRIACGLKKRGQPSPFKGQTHTEETRAHISAVRQAQIAAGMPSGFKGRKHSPEALEKMSAGRKGKTSPNKGVSRTAEATAKQSESMKRLHASPEYKEKMRAIEARSETKAKRSASAKAAWVTRRAAMEHK